MFLHHSGSFSDFAHQFISVIRKAIQGAQFMGPDICSTIFATHQWYRPPLGVLKAIVVMESERGSSDLWNLRVCAISKVGRMSLSSA